MTPFDITKPRTIVHNLTLKGIENVPGILDFDQRGILFARPGDLVITKRPPEKTYLSYLETLGWNFNQVSFISPASIVGHTYKSIYEDQTIIETIKDSKTAYLDTYQNTSEELAFSQRTNLPLYADPITALKYGTKSGFRVLAEKIGLPMVQGFAHLHSTEEVLHACLALFKTGSKTIVAKIDEGVSGAGATKFTSEIFLKLTPEEQHQQVFTALSKIPQMDKDSGMIVEEWSNDVVASPSIQLEVFPNGEIKIVSLHDQLLEGEEKWYVGCSYPPQTLTIEQDDYIRRTAVLFTKELTKEGYRGFFVLDTIITSTGKIYWVEANVRKPGTFYPRIIAEKLNNGTLKDVSYIASDFTVPNWKGYSFNQVQKIVSEFLYPMNKTNQGIIIYNTGALIDAGRFDMVCIAQNSKQAETIYKKVKSIIDLNRKEHV